MGRLARTKVIEDLSEEEKSRFMSKVKPQRGTGCILWQAGTDRQGYGLFWLHGRNFLAHRVAWFMTEGTQPPELDHLCEVYACVNPLHLEPVTHQENMRRALEKSHCKRGHELTPENRVGKNKECRECRKIHMKKYNSKRPSRGRGWYWRERSHCSSGHEYTEENTYRYPDGRRQCRACMRRYQADYQEKMASNGAN